MFKEEAQPSRGGTFYFLTQTPQGFMAPVSGGGGKSVCLRKMHQGGSCIRNIS